MPGFRWILLGIGLVVIAGIWWWTARRSRQAPGDAHLREFTVDTAFGSAPDPAPRSPMDPATWSSPHSPLPSPAVDGAVPCDTFAAEAASRDWGFPPFEPLSIRTAEFDDVPPLDLPMLADAGSPSRHSPAWVASVEEPLEMEESMTGIPAAAAAAAERDEPAEAHVAARAEAHHAAPAAAGVAPIEARTEPVANRETHRIVTLRVCSVGETRWPGASVMAALESQGLAHGRYKVFHRMTNDGRTLFCAASLIEPGTFDIARMPAEEYRGLTLFAVLPGPLEPMHMLDVLFLSAEALAAQLEGEVQDAAGVPFSPAVAAALRDDVARFQAQLS